MMNNIAKFGIIVFIVLIVPLFSMAQSVSKRTTIYGTVNLNQNYEASLSFQDDKNQEEPLIVTISKTGKFSFNFELDKSEFINFTIIPKDRKRQLAINFPLYILPGSKTQLNLNYNDSTYLKLKNSKVSNDNKALIAYSNFRFLKQMDWFKNPPTADQFKKVLHQYFDEAVKYNTQYNLKNPTVINYLQVWSMNDYIDNLSNQTYGKKNINYADFFKDLQPSPVDIYNKSQALLFSATPRNLNDYVKAIDTVSIAGKSKEAVLAHKIDFVNNLFSNQQLKNLYAVNELAAYTRSFVLKNNSSFDDEQKIFNQLAQKLANVDKRDELIQNFANLKYTINGAPLPPVAVKDLKGNVVKLEDFKGKYIYIDLWASWCIPCIAEVPNLQKLEKDYKDKNIVFLSISLDEDKDAWKNKVKELSLHGNQLEIGDSGFDKLMNVQGIPHFILYDADGKLMYYKAPRPGTQEIRTIFNTIQ